MADEDVCQQTAYILFYQRRATIPSWSANSSVAGEPLFTLTQAEGLIIDANYSTDCYFTTFALKLASAVE